jgi:hypothetical protein
MVTRCLVILQNAWSPMYAGDVWPRESWLRALHSCPTGRALKVIFPDQTGIEFDNTTAEVSEKPNGICEPDPIHIASAIGRAMPHYVLACGKQAEKALVDLWPGRLVCMPHPAWRMMRAQYLHEIRDFIERDDFKRIALSFDNQGRMLGKTIPPPASKQIHLF